MLVNILEFGDMKENSIELYRCSLSKVDASFNNRLTTLNYMYLQDSFNLLNL